MMKNMRAGIPNLFKGGTKHLTGLESTILRNAEACQELANITRTSLGPNGMNKMVINHLDKLFVTNDAATIIREMEIAHAAANMVVMAAQMQEQEVGDGSNFVVVFAGELMKQAAELIDMGVHPSEILQGYELAGKKVQEFLEEASIRTVEKKQLYERDQLADGIFAPIAAKQYGYEGFLSKLVAEACAATMPDNPFNFVVDNIRVCKLMGSNIENSMVLRGMVLGYDVAGSVKKAEKAKVAVFTCALDNPGTETKGTILIENAKDLMNFNESEEALMHKLIKSVVDSGAKVIVTGGSIDDMAKHFCNKYGVVVVKISSQFELRRICRSTGAKAQVKLGPVHPEDLGYCASVYTQEIGDTRVTVFSQDSKDDAGIATILLRASTMNILNDLERSCDDGVNVVRAMTRDGRFVPGAGAIDIELSRKLHAFAATRSGLEQYALKAYADALTVVPRTLAENAGMDSMNIISQLFGAHEKGETNVGVDVENSTVADMTKQGIIDHLGTKSSALRLATNAAVTILRVDQIIQSKPAGGPKAPQQQGHWDDQE